MKHILKAEDFNPQIIEELFKRALFFEKALGRRNKLRWLAPLDSKHLTGLKGVIMCSLFYEESTRTRFSFEAAMHRLGGQVISTENASIFSSAAKGESLEHTIQVISGVASPSMRYADIIVLRHPEIGAAERAAKVSGVPIINAGDGAGEHPTQALLDLYTIQRFCKRLDNLSVGFVGDLAFGRTVRSLAKLLCQYKNNRIYFIAPEGLKIGQDIKDYLRDKNVSFEESKNLKEVIEKIDFCYVTRVQKNHISDPKLIEEYQNSKDKFIISKEIYDISGKRRTFFGHPMPIDSIEQEIKPEVENLPRVIFLEQAGFGVPVRMALLYEVCPETVR